MATKKKAAVKKAPAKAKKPAAKKKAAPAVKKAPGIKARMSKSAMVSEIATKTALSKKQVDSVMAELEDLIERHMRKRAAGEGAEGGRGSAGTCLGRILLRMPAVRAALGAGTISAHGGRV